MAFRVLIIGGTGQVGAAVVRALASEPSCAEVVMVNRKAIALTADPRVRQVILDTAAAQFPAALTKLAQSMVAQGDPVYGASCVGVGTGSRTWSEEELKALEIGVVGGFARGCHAGGITQFALLSAAGSTAQSRIRYVRVRGLKEETVQGIGFKSLAIFRPDIIAGNVHTPSYAAWLGRLISGPFGTIEQDDIGRAFVAEFISGSAPKGVVYLENGAMRQRSRAFRPLSGSLRELCTRFARASCGGPQADGFEERVEVADDALIQTVESMALLVGEAAVGRDRFQETCRQRCVDALEELQKEEANRVAVREQPIPA
jgi:uncharacterized protein YbjT (DUF2867 family)